MVNLGKPSRGCQTCKSRRIKCDLSRPKCQRCLKSGRSCPGVPAENDLVFRNQTQIVADRSKTRQKSVVPNRDLSDRSITPLSDSDRSASDLISDGELSFALESLKPAPELGLSKEAIAISFLFRHFVPDISSSSSFMPYTETLRVLYPSSALSSAIRQTTAALSLAALACYPDMRHLRPEADSKYTQALQATNAAIRDPVLSKSNETLMCVLLMGIFEVMTASERSLRNYKQHMDGAVALTRHRGSKQFEDRLSLQLYRAVRSDYIFECIQQSKSIELSGEEEFWTGDTMESQSPLRGLYIQGIRITTLRERANSLFSPDNLPIEQDIINLIADSRKIDAQLTEWANSLPGEWHYDTIPHLEELPDDIENAAAWPGPLHTYRDKFLASVYDNYRCMRIYVQGVILRCVANLGQSARTAERKTLAQATLFTIRKLVDDISASVPYMLSVFPDSASLKANYRQTKASEALGGYLLIRPLYVASSVECIPEQQRRWLKGRLRAIAEGYGFHQARQLSSGPSSLFAGKRSYD